MKTYAIGDDARLTKQLPAIPHWKWRRLEAGEIVRIEQENGRNKTEYRYGVRCPDGTLRWVDDDVLSSPQQVLFD